MVQRRIPEEVIRDVQNANDIVDVVGEYVQLKKQGRSYIGLCPFHGEKTPSFSVTQEKQIFHCFGCGKGGNVLTFLMEIEDFSFHESLSTLAERGGITLPDIQPKEESSLSTEDQQILKAYEWLGKLYQHLLKHTKDGKDGYNYFKDRGITDETIDLFQLGFAPPIKDFTAEFLTKKGFHQQLLVRAGLLSAQEDDSVTDRFRGRTIFPIRNHLGKIIGFAGRSITNEQPKYLNSPESELFQKSKLLFNFDLAKKHIRKKNEVILFEGYMDVISAYQEGIKNVIATMGTALTEFQANLLRRYVDSVVICFDSDNAGLDGSYKAAQLLRKAGCHVKVTKMDSDIDPDGYIKKYGSDAFNKEVIQASDTFMTFYMRYIRKDFNLSIEDDRMRYIAEVLKQNAMIQSPVEREYYLKELSHEFDISMETLTLEMDTYMKELASNKDKSRKDRYTNKTRNLYTTKRILPAFHNAERHLIAYMFANKSIADKVQDEIGAAFNVEEHKVIITHLYAFYEEGYEADVSLFIEKIQDDKIRQLVTEIAMIPITENISETEINDYIRLIQSEKNEVSDIKELKEQQKIAEQQSDHIKAAEIAMKIIEINKQLKGTK